MASYCSSLLTNKIKTINKALKNGLVMFQNIGLLMHLLIRIIRYCKTLNMSLFAGD